MTGRHVVKVICEANDGRLPVVGCRVGTIRNSLVDAFNIPSQALAFVNGVEVGPSFRVQANDVLEFCKKHGYKGRRRMFTKAEILQEYTGYPDDVMDELFATLRHDDVNADGHPVWHEAAVDEWLDERYSRKRLDDRRDKVVPPNSVRIAGEEYDSLTPKEWRLMEVLLSSSECSVEIDKAIEDVWGHDAECKENALKQVIKRLNEKLERKKCPCLVSQDNGFVTITR